jgi:hypothetical protein
LTRSQTELLELINRKPAGPTRRLPRNQLAIERTIEALKKVGRLEGIDESTVALARTLAEALDKVDAQRYPSQTANLAKAMLDTLRVLKGNGDDSDRAFNEWLASMQTPMGHPSQP